VKQKLLLDFCERSRKFSEIVAEYNKTGRPRSESWIAYEVNRLVEKGLLERQKRGSITVFVAIKK